MMGEVRVRELLFRHGLKPKKGFGQNFLVDYHVLDKICANITKKDNVLEIGAGLGTLTKRLAEKAEKVVAYEIDRSLLPVLDEVLDGVENVEVINKDALKADFCDYEGFCAVANLPYYITAPLIFKLIEARLPRITVMVQSEVAERIVAAPGTKQYGALTVMIRYRCEARLVANVPRNCFVPRPDVDSAVIELTRREESLFKNAAEEEMFVSVVKAAFGKRRKTLVNCLSDIVSKEEATKVLQSCGFDVNIRGEKLSIEGFKQISEEIIKNKKF